MRQTLPTPIKQTNLIKRGNDTKGRNIKKNTAMADYQIYALEARCQMNDEMVQILKRENRRLAHEIAQIQINIPLPNFAAKWNEIKQRLDLILLSVFKTICKKPVTVDMAQINLRRHISMDGTIWRWEMVYPEEMGWGKHFKVLELNNTLIMPAFSEENEEFIRYLVEQNHINHYLLTQRLS
jgi:hypothetical protein